MMLKLFLLLGSAIKRLNGEMKAATAVPDDVKEGFFAVNAIMGSEVKRFIVELEYLQNPAFLRLLELAGEEFGFRQKGALSLPCRPKELQRILEEPCTC